MWHGYRECIEIFFSYHKFRQPSAIRMLIERLPERRKLLTKRTKRLIHDLTESCFTLRVALPSPPPRLKRKRRDVYANLTPMALRDVTLIKAK